MAIRIRSVGAVAVAMLVSTASTARDGQPARTIRDVDFWNFTYAPSCLEYVEHPGLPEGHRLRRHVLYRLKRV